MIYASVSLLEVDDRRILHDSRIRQVLPQPGVAPRASACARAVPTSALTLQASAEHAPLGRFGSSSRAGGPITPPLRRIGRTARQTAGGSLGCEIRADEAAYSGVMGNPLPAARPT